MYKRFNLLVGTLRIKSEEGLRTVERQGRIPKLQFGDHYLIWWSRANERRYPPRVRRTPAEKGGVTS